jgi:hypothetical protein
MADDKKISVEKHRLGYCVNLPNIWAAGVLLNEEEAIDLKRALQGALPLNSGDAVLAAKDQIILNTLVDARAKLGSMAFDLDEVDDAKVMLAQAIYVLSLSLEGAGK